MNILKKTNNECDNVLLPTSPTFTNYYCLTFNNNLNVGVVLGRNCCLKKIYGKKEGKGKKRCSRVAFLILLFTKTLTPLFSLILNFLTCRKLINTHPIKNAIDIFLKTLICQT